jgi:hypothetical protein
MGKEQTDRSKKTKKQEKELLIDIELLIYLFSHLLIPRAVVFMVLLACCRRAGRRKHLQSPVEAYLWPEEGKGRTYAASRAGGRVSHKDSAEKVEPGKFFCQQFPSLLDWT